MFYRLVAPADFFESSHYPPVCLFSGRTTELTPIDLDLSFIRARAIPSTHRGQAVTDLVTDDQIYAALSGHVRKTSRNLLLTLPADAAAFGRWRLHTRWIPLLLLLCLPLAAMSTALIWPAWAKLYWVLGAVFLGLVAGAALATLYRNRQTDSPHFGVSEHGYVVITLPDCRREVAVQLSAAVSEHFSGRPPAAVSAPPPENSTATDAGGTVVEVAAQSDIAIVESHS